MVPPIRSRRTSRPTQVENDMTEDLLTFEERRHLWNRVIASFLVATFSLTAWLLFFEQAQFPLTGWKIFIWVGLPFGTVLPVSFFLPYEVLYPKRVRKAPMFHVLRFLRRTLSLIVVILSFTSAASFSDVLFSRTLGDQAWFPGFGLCLFVFIVAAILWMKSQNSRRLEL